MLVCLIKMRLIVVAKANIVEYVYFPYGALYAGEIPEMVCPIEPSIRAKRVGSMIAKNSSHHDSVPNVHAPVSVAVAQYLFLMLTREFEGRWNATCIG